MTRKSIIEGVYEREKSNMSRGSSLAWLCWSSTHLVQCEPDEPSWTWTQIWVQARMPDHGLNWTALSSAIQGWQRCQLYWSLTWRRPSLSRRPFGLKSAMEHWPSSTNARQSADQSAKMTSLTILSSVFMKNGAFPLLFTGWVYTTIKCLITV